MNKNLAEETTPNYAGGCANSLLAYCIIFISELLTIFEIFSIFDLIELLQRSLYVNCNNNISAGIEHRMPFTDFDYHTYWQSHEPFSESEYFQLGHPHD